MDLFDLIENGNLLYVYNTVYPRKLFMIRPLKIQMNLFVESFSLPNISRNGSFLSYVEKKSYRVLKLLV